MIERTENFEVSSFVVVAPLARRALEMAASVLHCVLQMFLCLLSHRVLEEEDKRLGFELL